MYKTFTALLILSFCLASCRQKEQQNEEANWPHELYWYFLRGTHQEVYYLPLKIAKANKDTSIKFIYQTPFDTSTYTISIKHPKRASLLSPSYTDSLFYFVSKHAVPVVGGKDFMVYQFSKADGMIDGGTEHYWNERFGFFFIRGTTWSSYRVLQFEDEEKNKEVWELVKTLHPRIEQNLKLAGVQQATEHIRQAHHTVVGWNWRE